MTDASPTSKPSTPRRKPRIALMGEFSAGKSTLMNLLLACTPLPVRVTATSVPPVWISHGEDAAWLEYHDGRKERFDLAEFDQTQWNDVRLIRLSMQADALEICDLFDMPGISDPNLPTEEWQSILDEVDSVIWCTHATQAWRQSEAATWEEIASKTNGNNILLITQIDKVTNPRDRARLLARVKKETQSSFRAVFPLSLIDAIQSVDDQGWQESGAAEFSDYLVEMLLSLKDGALPSAPLMQQMAPAMAPPPPAPPIAQAVAPSPSDPAQHTDPKIMPRRIAPRAAGNRPRRRAPAIDGGSHV